MNHVLVGGLKHYLIYMNDVDVPLCSGRHTTARLVPRDDPVAAGQGSHPCADPTTRTAPTTPNNINTHAHTHARTDAHTHARTDARKGCVSSNANDRCVWRFVVGGNAMRWDCTAAWLAGCP